MGLSEVWGIWKQVALTPHSGSAHEGSKTTQKDSKQQGVHRPSRLQDAAAAPEGAEERLRAAGAPEGAGEAERAHDVSVGTCGNLWLMSNGPPLCLLGSLTSEQYQNSGVGDTEND